jgi:hypothetical protein
MVGRGGLAGGLLLLLLGSATLGGAEPDKRTWKAGLAVQVITPTEPMWMAGYGARNKPAEGKETELFVKALALEDPAGGRLVLVTSDLVGIPRALGEEVAGEVRRRTGLPRERLLLTCSHTHCGPVLNGNLIDMYPLTEAEAKKIGPYTDKVRRDMTAVVVRALEDLKPARLEVGKGTARFAVNRRQPTPKGIINGTNPDGPVDHEVPVLVVSSPDGKLKAAVFGYACHNTTLSWYRWCGDYAGYAQAEVEKKHPGAVALFWTGCGADANPLPRSKLELCQQYGKMLADAVEDVLGGTKTPIQGTSAAKYATVSLPFASIPGKEQLAADLLSKTFAVRKRAERFQKVLDAGGKIDDHYPHYPVQVWRLGGQVTWVALGGEVVVDYSRRLKRELAGEQAVWVAGYANDVMAYIPSERVLKEGGYEADSSMIYYGQPSKWAPGLEEKIVRCVKDLVKETAPRKDER